MTRVFIGLGTNLGDRHANLSEAISLLGNNPRISLTQVSTRLETEPVDYLDQPDFINQMMEVETDLPPEDLFAVLQNIEEALGREKKIPKGPRIIDLDIILFGEQIINSENLAVPHPRRLERDFIVKHLAELDSELKDPVTGEYYRDLI